jgi:hypothetical protein
MIQSTQYSKSANLTIASIFWTKSIYEQSSNMFSYDYNAS